MNIKFSSYKLLTKQALALIDGEPDLIANLSNLSALIDSEVDQINWVGFYLLHGDELVLGPFQGKPACVRIPVGRGVCGSAVHLSQVMRVDDVHQFEGHIACDSASRSELVIPIFIQNRMIGVLDIDSPVKGRFSEDDEQGFVNLMKEVEKLFNSHANALLFDV